MNKLIVIIILIVVVSGIGWAIYEAGDSNGYNRCQKELKDSEDKAESEDKADIKEIIKWRTKEKKVYVDKIKYIENVQDPTGCADVKLTDMGFGLQ